MAEQAGLVTSSIRQETVVNRAVVHVMNVGLALVTHVPSVLPIVLLQRSRRRI